MSARHHIQTTLFFLTISGCTTPGSKPDDMSRSEHEAAAEAHAARAEEHEEKYDPNAQTVRQPPAGVRSKNEFAYPLSTYNPTDQHKKAAAQHQQEAKEHAAAAQALASYEDGVCGSLPPETRAMCPLLGALKSVTNIEGGVYLVPVDGTNLDAWTAHLQCHAAFALSQGSQGMTMCPLFQPGVRVERAGAGVNIKANDPVVVEKLRQLARAHQ